MTIVTWGGALLGPKPAHSARAHLELSVTMPKGLFHATVEFSVSLSSGQDITTKGSIKGDKFEKEEAVKSGSQSR